MNKINKSKQSGFTLAEIIVVLFISTLLMLGVTTIVVDIFRNNRQQMQSLNDVYQSTIVISKFTNEIRNATTGSDGSSPLNQAGNAQIIFYSSAEGNGSTVQRIRYYLSGNTLYEGIVTPTGSPLSYNLSSEVVTPVQNYVVNTSTPVFLYYNGNYAGTSTPLSQPVNVNQVKFVAINILVANLPGTSSSTYPISAGATLRNLKNNLGN